MRHAITPHFHDPQWRSHLRDWITWAIIMLVLMLVAFFIIWFGQKMPQVPGYSPLV